MTLPDFFLYLFVCMLFISGLTLLRNAARSLAKDDDQAVQKGPADYSAW